MKIALECKCLILEESLKLFLSNYVTNRNLCDFIITDTNEKFNKPVFVISDKNSHLKLPFTREILFNLLEEFYSAIQIPAAKIEIKNQTLESRLDAILAKFKHDLLEILREK